MMIAMLGLRQKSLVTLSDAYFEPFTCCNLITSAPISSSVAMVNSVLSYKVSLVLEKSCQLHVLTAKVISAYFNKYSFIKLLV